MSRRNRRPDLRPLSVDTTLEPDRERPGRSWIVRLGAAIVGGAVIVSSLLPLLELFNRAPRQEPVPTELQPISRAESAVIQEPSDPATWETLARALEAAGRPDQAAMARREASRRRSLRRTSSPAPALAR
jgi:cytochrome c-type biogenesis protein CcmH/NrfG